MCFPLMAIFHSYVRLSLMDLTNSGMIVLIASLKTMMIEENMGFHMENMGFHGLSSPSHDSMEGKHGLSEKGHTKLGCTEALNPNMPGLGVGRSGT